MQTKVTHFKGEIMKKAFAKKEKETKKESKSETKKTEKKEAKKSVASKLLKGRK